MPIFNKWDTNTVALDIHDKFIDWLIVLFSFHYPLLYLREFLHLNPYSIIYKYWVSMEADILNLISPYQQNEGVEAQF